MHLLIAHALSTLFVFSSPLPSVFDVIDGGDVQVASAQVWGVPAAALVPAQ